MELPPPTRRPLLEELVRRRIRLTAQRRVLIEILQQSDVDLDAPELLERARRRDARIDRATVYRTLELLKKLHLKNTSGSTQPVSEAKAAPDHVHLSCLQCGRVDTFTSGFFEQLKAEVSRGKGFQIRAIRIEAGGLCHGCKGGTAGQKGIGRVSEGWN